MAADYWDRLYRSSDVSELPWYTPTLDEHIATALRDHGPVGGRILDLGTGPGTQAVELAKLGLEVLATDISPAAIRTARARAKAAGVKIDFRVDNVLDSRLEDASVAAIVDRGVFHTVAPEARPRYVEQVRRILAPGGLLLLKTFSDQEPGEYGPYRFSPGELRSCFLPTFDLISLEDAVFQGPQDWAPKALFAVFRRR